MIVHAIMRIGIIGAFNESVGRLFTHGIYSFLGGSGQLLINKVHRMRRHGTSS